MDVPYGNVITTGYFAGTANFNPGGSYPLTSNGFDDIFISKLNSSGSFSWAKSMGGSLSDASYGLVLDGSNNIYSCGVFTGTADFDPSGPVVNLAGPSALNGYVHKLNSSGTFQWVKGFFSTGTSDTWCTDIDMDATSNLYISGYHFGTTDFDPGTSSMTLTAAGSSDMFGLKLDGSGTYLWAESHGSAAPDYGLSIHVLTNNEFYISGGNKAQFNFEDAPICGPSVMPYVADYDIYVAKWGPDLDAGWHNTTKNTQFAEIYNDVITDQQGNVYVVGTFTKSTTLEGGDNPDVTINSGLSSTLETNTFVAKYNQCGNLVWASNSTDFLGNTGNGIALDENAGMVYITGNFNQVLRFSSAVSYDGLCTVPNTVTIFTTGSVRGYVAQFDMNTGCLYFVNPMTLVSSGLID
ncbi:MAG TPA: hypothetical protein VD905_01895, partial [Flavobacteriales bacterium]|nr:hypothetical protein [Flavobacteriales bacterium]